MYGKDNLEKLLHVRLSKVSNDPGHGVMILTTNAGVRKFSVDTMRADLLLDEILAFFDVSCRR